MANAPLFPADELIESGASFNGFIVAPHFKYCDPAAIPKLWMWPDALHDSF